MTILSGSEDQDCKKVESTSSSSNNSLDGDENKTRGNWSGRMDFLLSCIGYAVGLGNIWRFPYLCYRSGGGAFLIPYVLFLLICGIPLFFMEVSIGQFASLSPITIWRISPLFKGVGYGMVLISGIVCVYYNIIITWTLYYLYMSFRAVLPWSTCNNEWNTKYCSINRNQTVGDAFGANLSLINGSHSWYSMYSNESFPLGHDGGNFSENVTHKVISASEEFWQRHVLELSDGIDDMGTIRWQLLICLAVAWLCVFLCLFKGIKSSGKVVYVTATFPYLVLVILLVRGVTLPGAGDGIRYYLIPKWEKLLTFKVWGDAAIQIFYSVGMAWGGLITMSSYNKFKNNIYRDALIVPLVNCGTSVFAGLVIFSVLGFMAKETGVNIEDVVTQGPGLTFVAYPEAVSKFPLSPLWAVLFFLMLFTIGLDSQFGMFETMTSAFIDEFPTVLRSKKLLFTGGLCFLEFLLGLPCIFQGGIYVLQIMDWYCSSFSLMLLSLIECVAIAWIYGADRFIKDISLMIGYEPCFIWKICWRYLTPITILAIWLFSVSTLGPVTYGSKEYPSWAITFGWILGSIPLLPIPIIMIYEMYRAKGTLLERFKKAIRPSPEWGPALDKYRESYFQTLTDSEKQYYRKPAAEALLEPVPQEMIAFCPPENGYLLDQKVKV